MAIYELSIKFLTPSLESWVSSWYSTAVVEDRSPVGA